MASEIEKVRDLLAFPHVHLAIDPEFAVAEGQIPGEYIGSVTAESITYAQQVLAEISATHGIPPKLLVVHQFREDMITNKEQLGALSRSATRDRRRRVWCAGAENGGVQLPGA